MADAIANDTGRGVEHRWLNVSMLAVAWLGMAVFTFHACTRMVAAGDTWVAMGCGRHFINHGVDTVEPFSANSHKPGPTPAEVKTWPAWAKWITEKVGLETVKTWHPTGWVNQNWLTHVIFYWLTTALGSEQEPYFDALVIWKVALYMVSVVCIYSIGRVLGVHPLLSAAFACLAMFVGRSFLDIRPAGFSNLLVPVFVLILALATYRNILYVWLIVPITVFWANVHGGYVYVFIMLVPFMVLHLLSIPFKNRLVSIGWKGMAHTAGAYAVAFVAMVVFNPFHLTNLTHTFVISVSKNAEKWRNVHEWHEAFDWTNPVGTAVPFLVMVIIAWTAAVAWVVTRTAAAASVGPSEVKSRKRRPESSEYQLPKVDLAMCAIAAMTIYMAIRSRRFIPIAAFAAVPVLALVIQQMIASILAAASCRRQGQVSMTVLTEAVGDVVMLGLSGALAVLGFWVSVFWNWLSLPVPEHPESVQPHLVLTVAGVLLAFLAFPLSAVFYFAPGRANDPRSGVLGRRSFVRPTLWVAALLISGSVIGFGAWMGLKVKSIYLDPWPLDAQYRSIFMRMTASGVKPFEACKFIRDNHLSGNMMNYWTEGGFIAWGQEPDLKTGKTPLQLFMDGRAQAGYDCKTFDEWSYIWAGGEPVQRAQARGKAITAPDYPEIGRWASQRLRTHGVWVVLSPVQQFDYAFIRGLESNPEWPMVYLDNKQKLYIDIQSPSGRHLFEGIKTGQTVYPDPFTRNLNLAYHLLIYDPSSEAKSMGLQYAIESYRLNPSPVPMLGIVNYADRYPDLRPQIKAFCEELYQDFEAKRDVYRRQDGYRGRLEGARMAADYLGRIALQLKNPQVAQVYSNKVVDYRDERDDMTNLKRW